MERLDKGCRRWEFEERFTGKEERGRRGMVKKLWRFGGVSVGLFFLCVCVCVFFWWVGGLG